MSIIDLSSIPIPVYVLVTPSDEVKVFTDRVKRERWFLDHLTHEVETFHNSYGHYPTDAELLDEAYANDWEFIDTTLDDK